MRDNRLALRLAHTVLAICTPIVLLLGNLYLLASPWYLRHEYSRPSFPRSSIFSPDERLSLAEATLNYMRSGQDVSFIEKLSAQGRSVYNYREVVHLADAKRVMNAAFLVHGVAVAIVLLSALTIWYLSKGWSSALQSMARGCIGFFLMMMAIGVFAYAQFDRFFTLFHRLLFTGDSWLFPYTDTLIQLFPLPFWMDATYILALLTLGQCVAVGIVGLIFSRAQG